MKILCIGAAAYDITLPVIEYPRENTKNRINNIMECGGGPASNAAYLIGKWGLDVHFAGVVGNDSYGEKIEKEFKTVNVNTKYLQKDKSKPTQISYILANSTNGSRTILSYREEGTQLKDIKLNFKPDYILVDGHEFETSKEIIEKYKDAVTIIDAGSAKEKTITLAKMCNYVVSSKVFAEDVTGIKINYKEPETLKQLYKKMTEIFKGIIVVTLEDKGCLYSNNEEIKIMKSIKVTPVDSTGAGDIYHGAFVYGLAKGFELEKTLKIANVAGAMSVTRLGGRNSVLTKEEMKEVINEFE